MNAFERIVLDKIAKERGYSVHVRGEYQAITKMRSCLQSDETDGMKEDG